MSWGDALARKERRAQRPAALAPTPPTDTSGLDRYVRAALDGECAELRATAEGQRNDRLNAAAFALGQFIGAGVLSESTAWSELRTAAQACGLGASEADATIGSGINAGKQEPRGVPERSPRRAERSGPPPDDGWLEAEPSDAEAPEAEPQSERTPVTPSSIVATWRTEGPLVRVPTGIAALDRLCRGGLPVPWRVIVVGAPSAGKTAVSTNTADNFARAAASAGLCVGILAVDEEPDDITVRLAQLAGYSVAQLEEREPDLLAEVETALSALRVRFYDSSQTIEAAASDLARWCEQEQRRGMLMIDSVQAATSALAVTAKTPREYVEANVRAIRWAATHHRLLVIATSEANRGSYRSEDAAETTNDMAAGAESRAIEFGAQTQLMLRTPKDYPDVIHVRVAKNRRADRGEFWLRLDRENHTLTECADPNAGAAGIAASEGRKVDAGRLRAERDAETLAAFVAKRSGIGSKELRIELRAAGHAWGIERLGAAQSVLSAGHKGLRLVDAGTGNGRRWAVVPTDERGSP